MSCFVEISELNANSVDADQTPRSVASDLGPYCLPVSLLWEARLIWIKGKKQNIGTRHIISIKIACVPSEDSGQPSVLSEMLCPGVLFLAFCFRSVS